MALQAAPGSLAGCPPRTTAQAMPIGVQLGKGADPLLAQIGSAPGVPYSVAHPGRHAADG